MKGITNKKMIKFICLSLIFLLCLLYLLSKVTYTSYESEVDGNINAAIASWNINIDSKNITKVDSTMSLKIDDIKWNTSNVREGKVAPGSVGDMVINIDPTGTDVAIYYELEVIDKSVNPDKLLLVTSISSGNDAELVKIDKNVYAGLLSLEDINAGKKPRIDVKVIWEDDEDIVYDFDMLNDLDSYLVINFMARQYLGEDVLTPYLEEGDTSV